MYQRLSAIARRRPSLRTAVHRPLKMAKHQRKGVVACGRLESLVTDEWTKGTLKNLTA